jgi:hypothetical protein
MNSHGKDIEDKIEPKKTTKVSAEPSFIQTFANFAFEVLFAVFQKLNLIKSPTPTNSEKSPSNSGSDQDN